MTAPRVGPCSDWTTAADLADYCEIPAGKDALVTRQIASASALLYELSGRKFPGDCELTVRPCAQMRQLPGGLRLGYREYVYDDGVWGSSCGCQLGPSCACSSISEITLGRTPVTDVSEVIVADFTNPAWPGDSVLPTGLYRVDEFRRLVRLPNPDGSRPSWPCCQRIDLPAGDERTFEVTFTHGYAPPAPGVEAANALACQLILAITDPKSCALGPRTQQVARQGVTIVLDRLTAIRNDLVGIPTVDLFLRAYNPTKRRGRARVATADSVKSTRRTDT